MRSPYTLLTIVLLTATACGTTNHAMTPDPELRDRLEPVVERAMARGLVPGFQIAVVTRDGGLWSASYGMADVETGRPVRNDTRFYLASTSKAIMGLTGALLDHQGVIDFDATLAEVFPADTRFHPGYDPSSATVLDLLTHTHGLNQPPPLTIRYSYSGDYTNAEVLQFLGMATPREDRSFNYTNLGYNLYGLLMTPEETFGWKPMQDSLVLEPLGMAHTTNYPSTLDSSVMAMPHAVAPEGFQRIRVMKGDRSVSPAGGHFSTAEDLARLALMELNLGRLGGEQLFPTEVIAATQRQTVAQDREIFYYHRYGWGIGWDLGTYDGDTVVHRPGSFAGFYSNVAFMPDYGFGVAVATNGGRNGGILAETVVGAIYDIIRGREDAVERMEERLDRVAAAIEEERQAVAEIMAEYGFLDRPLRPLEAYTGTYTHPIMGRLEVRRDGDRLVAELGELRTLLRPQARGEDPDMDPFFGQLLDADDQLQFNFGAGGVAESVGIRGLPVTLTRQN